jgi:hypothetical protein
MREHCFLPINMATVFSMSVMIGYSVFACASNLRPHREPRQPLGYRPIRHHGQNWHHDHDMAMRPSRRRSAPPQDDVLP